MKKEGFKIRRKKKGLSPIIATVMLIALVMFLAVLIFIYFHGFLQEQVEKFGSPVENVCEDILFDVRLIEAGNAYLVEMVNSGNVPITYFNVKQFYGGDSKLTAFSVSLDSGESASNYLPVFEKDEQSPDKLILYPVVVGEVRGKQKNKPFTCIDQGKTITF